MDFGDFVFFWFEFFGVSFNGGFGKVFELLVEDLLMGVLDL